jgi:hypothetical protein
MTRRTRAIVAAASAVAAVLVAIERRPGIRGHEPIASKYTYNEHVFPIVRERCGGCHIAGGAAPMSLLTYDDAHPWAQSIKEEIISQTMPPWHAEDGFGSFRHPQSLTAREVDILVDWAMGATPEGDPAKRPAPVALENAWASGTPDLVLEFPAEQVLSESESEKVVEVRLATGFTTERWIRAVDVRPGNPAITRSAVVYLETPGPEQGRLGAGSPSLWLQQQAAGYKRGEPRPVRRPSRTPIGTWLPGQAPIATPAAYRVPPGAVLTARVHYKKTWTLDGKRISDRSAVGLYGTADPGDAIESRPLDIAFESVARAATTVHRVDRDVDVIALYPERTPAGTVVTIEARRPDKTRERLLRLVRDDREWPRRFWLTRPVRLPKGSRLEIQVAPWTDPGGKPLPALPTSGSLPAATIWIDTVASRAQRAER